jgi:hypothetical protein
LEKIVKLAIIRNNEDQPCPFGLDITHACLKAGELVQNMAPIEILGSNPEEDEIEQLKAANRRLFDLKKPNTNCIYANKIFKDKNAVECGFKFGSSDGNSNDSVPFPAPFYAKNYDNSAFDNMSTFPIGYYADYDLSRNLYYGLYSLQGSEDKSVEFEKFAGFLVLLNDSYDLYNNNMKLILKNFAENYANKLVLVKNATLFPEFNKILIILNRWKDK